MTASPDSARIPEDLDAVLEGWRSGQIPFDRGMDQVRGLLQQMAKRKSFVSCAPAVAAKLVEVALGTKHAVPNIIPAIRLGGRVKKPNPLLHWAVVVAAHEQALSERIRESDRVGLLRSALMETWSIGSVGKVSDPDAVRYAVKALNEIGDRATLGVSPEHSLLHAVEQAALALGHGAGSEVEIAGFRVTVPAPAPLAVIPVSTLPGQDIQHDILTSQDPVSGAHDPEAARRAAREAELKRRANDAEALSRQAEDLARRLNRRLDEAESELGRLRGTIIDRETEIAGLIVRCDILADAQERLLRSEAQFSRVSSELMAFRAEQDDLIAHARSQAAAQAVLQFCQLASAPMATLRQLESSLPAGQREVLGACLAQLEISMRPPGG